MVPYLKGFHLTIEMWRGGRDTSGYKLTDDDDISVPSLNATSNLDCTRALSHVTNPEVEDENDGTMTCPLVRAGVDTSASYAPSDGITTAVPQLIDNITALQVLSDFNLPPLLVVRPANVFQVFYRFADASGK